VARCGRGPGGRPGKLRRQAQCSRGRRRGALPSSSGAGGGLLGSAADRCGQSCKDSGHRFQLGEDFAQSSIDLSDCVLLVDGRNWFERHRGHSFPFVGTAIEYASAETAGSFFVNQAAVEACQLARL